MFLLYRSLLALHIIAVISWMAGVLYLYRLFVYHAAEKEKVVKARFQMMEEKLYRMILMPAMGAAAVLGIAMLALKPNLLHQPWLHLKLMLAAGLIGVSVWAGRLREQLARGECPISSNAFRLLNEVPTLLMIAIVFLVILRPFS